MNIFKRIQIIIDRCAFSQADFCDSTGIPEIDLKQLINRGSAITYSHIYQICKAYPQLNADWLITGKGKMQKEIFKNESEYLKIKIKITNTMILNLRILREEEFHFRQTGNILREKIAAYMLNTTILEKRIFDLASYSSAKTMTSNLKKDAFKLFKSVYSQYSTQVSPEKLNVVVAFHLTYLYYITNLQNWND
jgi:hypothetical protein